MDRTSYALDPLTVGISSLARKKVERQKEGDSGQKSQHISPFYQKSKTFPETQEETSL